MLEFLARFVREYVKPFDELAQKLKLESEPRKEYSVEVAIHNAKYVKEEGLVILESRKLRGKYIPFPVPGVPHATPPPPETEPWYRQVLYIHTHPIEGGVSFSTQDIEALVESRPRLRFYCVGSIYDDTTYIVCLDLETVDFEELEKFLDEDIKECVVDVAGYYQVPYAIIGYTGYRDSNELRLVKEAEKILERCSGLWTCYTEIRRVVVDEEIKPEHVLEIGYDPLPYPDQLFKVYSRISERLREYVGDALKIFKL